MNASPTLGSVGAPLMAPVLMRVRDVMTPLMAPVLMRARDVMTPLMAPGLMQIRNVMTPRPDKSALVAAAACCSPDAPDVYRYLFAIVIQLTCLNLSINTLRL